jgi:integrase/recombinase XerD
LHTRLSRRQVRLLEANEQDFVSDIQRLKHSRYKPNTIARYVVCAKGFFNFLVMRGVVTTNPASRIRRPKTSRFFDPSRLLTKDELEALLSTESPPGPVGKRNSLIIKLIAKTPLRLYELAALTLEQIDLVKGVGPTLLRRERSVQVFFDKDVLREIQDYVSTHRPHIPVARRSEYLFPAKHGGAMSRQAIWYILLDYKENTGLLKRVTATDLRRSYRAHHTKN